MKKLFITTLCAFLISGFAITANAQTLQQDLEKYETVVNKCVKAYKESLTGNKSADKTVNTFNAYLKEARGLRDKLQKKQKDMKPKQLDLYKKTTEKLAEVDPQKGAQSEATQVKPEVKPAEKSSLQDKKKKGEENEAAVKLQNDLKKYESFVKKYEKTYKKSLKKDDKSADKNVTNNDDLKQARKLRDELQKKQKDMTPEQLDLYKKTTEKLAGVDPKKTVQPETPQVKPGDMPSFKDKEKKVEENQAAVDLQKDLNEFERLVNKCVKAYKESLTGDKSVDKNVNSLDLQKARDLRDELQKKQKEMTPKQLDHFKELMEQFASVDITK
jgi:hypothetical protein